MSLRKLPWWKIIDLCEKLKGVQGGLAFKLHCFTKTPPTALIQSDESLRRRKSVGERIER